MKNYLRVYIAALALGCNSPSFANFAMSPSGGTTAFAIDAANQGTSLCAAASTECPAHVIINTAGAPLFTSAAPGFVSQGSASVASGAYASGSIASGAMVDLGSQADAAAAADNSTASLIALLKRTNQNITTLNTTAGSSIPAGTALIGGIELYDGGGATKGTIKAASTLPAATDTTMVVGLNPGTATAGSPTGAIVTVQGVASGTPIAHNTAQVNGVTVLTGTGATGTGAQRVTVSTDQATNAGAALVKGGVGTVNGGSFYQHVAASQTGAVLQSSTGAIGDYLSHCVIYPATTAAGSVTVFDNANAAGTNVIEFSTGTLSNLAPIAIPVGAVSTAGAWKVTTGANETVVCYGKFS